MKYVVLFIICATILFTLIPQSYAELYYNEKYSFSVDIPSGWIVDDLGVEGGGWQENIKKYGEIELYEGAQGNKNDLLRLVNDGTYYDIVIVVIIAI